MNKVYIVWSDDGLGEQWIHKVFKTREAAEEAAIRFEADQDSDDNFSYYYYVREYDFENN